MEEEKITLDTEYFRTVLKEQLKKINCSQKQLAEYLKVSENTVSSWLSDNQKSQPHGLRLMLSVLEFIINKDKEFNPTKLFIPDWVDPQVKNLQNEKAHIEYHKKQLETKNMRQKKNLEAIKGERDKWKNQYSDKNSECEELKRECEKIKAKNKSLQEEKTRLLHDWRQEYVTETIIQNNDKT